MNVALLHESRASEPAPRRSESQVVRVPTLCGALIGCGALMGATLRTAFAYRMATLFAVFVGLLGQSVFLWVWLAVYRENPRSSAPPERELFSYLIVALVFNAM